MSHRWCYSRLNNQDFDLKKKYCRPILEKAMATHSSTLAWKIPWIEEPGRLQSIGSLRVGHDWATSLSFSLSCIGEGKGNPLQCSCLENPRDRGAWWAAIYGVTQSRTRLKWLSSSSSRPIYLDHRSKTYGREEYRTSPKGTKYLSYRTYRARHEWAFVRGGKNVFSLVLS